MNKDARRLCPEEEDFLGAFLSGPDGPERKSLVRHAAACPRCSRKFRALTQLEAELEAKGKDIQDSGLSDEERRRLEKMARQRLGGLRRQQRRSFLKPHPRAAILLGIGLAALILASFFVIKNSVPRDVWRGSPGQELALIEPQGSLEEAPDTFVWKEVKGREEFVFVLQDEQLNLLYRTKTYATRVRIPEAVHQSLVRGKTYLWTVEAKDKNSHVLASDYLVFKIEK